MIPHPSQARSEKPSLASEHTFEVLVRFAALMWRSGNTAIRTRECIGLMARKLGFDDVVLSLSLEAVTVSACRARVWTTATRSPGPPAVNTRRIAELEQLAKAASAGDGARDLESKLAEIESRPPLYSTAQIAGAIALASASAIANRCRAQPPRARCGDLASPAFGLGIVIAIAGVDLSRPPPIAIAYPLKLLLRAAASFVAASAFALSFNSTPPTLAVGLLALGANSLGLILIDIGLMPAPAAFFAALVIGLAALAMDWRFNVPPTASTVAPIIIMIPGLSAFEAIVLFNLGQVLEVLRAAAMCGFVIGALAIGLASARLFGR
jgi:uncharacterized membrane protein YjjP (DUF1212 family)